MKVLVCGGRDFPGTLKGVFTSEPWLWLKRLNISHIIHGGARGADSLAYFFATSNQIPQTVYHADWKKHGKAAGFIRNQEMLDKNPDIEAVIAFPGGKGTADMVARARKKGIRVIEYA